MSTHVARSTLLEAACDATYAAHTLGRPPPDAAGSGSNYSSECVCACVLLSRHLLDSCVACVIAISCAAVSRVSPTATYVAIQPTTHHQAYTYRLLQTTPNDYTPHMHHQVANPYQLITTHNQQHTNIHHLPTRHHPTPPSRINMRRNQPNMQYCGIGRHNTTTPQHTINIYTTMCD